MKKYILGAMLALICILQQQIARAESEAACAIWLCLPGGFPTGCSAAYTEFKHRLKKGRSPLPNLSSCAAGPDGPSTNGRYVLGVDYFMPCKEGFEIDENILSSSGRGICKSTKYVCMRSPRYWRGADCSRYNAIRRAVPYYVEIWIEGQYLGKFYHQ